LNTYRSDRV